MPLALLAALYAIAVHASPVKAYVKPVVEIMAALPSVVLGFLAGLWLAPMIERHRPRPLRAALVLPALVLAALLLWPTRADPSGAASSRARRCSSSCPSSSARGPGWPSPSAASIETLLLGGNFRGWLLSPSVSRYDQRNSLVVGVAMGFAVIPIIFTIAEDSLANVPAASRRRLPGPRRDRWQTALRVVLPTAQPRIFSAIMVGFGRAVGETMIVLMATGNTPIMDWSIFNGFRALSANIAVEMPEAPAGRDAVPRALPRRACCSSA